MNAMYFIAGSIMACGFVVVGWGDEGYLAHICLILGGLYFGHLITEALNEGTK